MIKPPRDNRTYHFTELSNGVKVMFVHDAECRKSAAAVSVRCGQFHEPDQINGLSHLLEHMLFLGCEAFPQPNHLSHHVSQYGGQANAWTGTESSHYFFDVQHDGFLTACEQFMAMLQKPLFHIGRIQKEIEAIDAEFLMKQQDDLRRLYQVHKETCNPAHPFSRFAVGNKEVFSAHSLETLQSALETLHGQQYVADKLAFCFISALPPDSWMHQIEKRLEEFSSLPGKEPDYPPLYLPTQRGVQIQVMPLQTACRMIMTFTLPSLHMHTRSKPLDFISQLLGDEGNGSLFCVLKQAGWCTGLSAGGGISGSHFRDFNINMQLTETGLAHYHDVCELVFAKIEQIKHEGLPRWRFEERQHLGQQVFDFQDPAKPIDLVQQIAANLHDVPPNECLSADYLLSEFDPALFDEAISYFTPENLRLKLIHPQVHTDKVASWYNTPYSIDNFARQLPASHTQTLMAHLSLPDKNPYIMSDFSLLANELEPDCPQRLVDTSNFQFWYCAEHTFASPRGEFYLSFDTPYVLGGVGNQTLKRIWVAVLQEHLNERYYQAGIAGLNISAYAHQGGFTIHTSGFAEKQPLLIEQISQQLGKLPIEQQKFEQIRHRQLQSAQNSLLNKPINRLMAKLNTLMQAHAWEAQDIATVLEQVSYEQLLLCSEQLLNQYHLQAYMHGNWQKQHARQMQQHIQTSLIDSATTCSEIDRQIIDLSGMDRMAISIERSQDESAVVLYLQARTASVLDKAKTILLEQLLASDFFHELRTEKQLGYLVGSGYYPINNHPGLVFYVQSPHSTEDQLEQAIITFLEQRAEALLQDPPENWPAIVHSVARQLIDQDINFAVKVQKNWMAIANKDFTFDENMRVANAMQTITPAQLADFCQRLISPTENGGLVLHTGDELHSPLRQRYEHIANVSEFKLSAGYIPTYLTVE